MVLEDMRECFRFIPVMVCKKAGTREGERVMDVGRWRCGPGAGSQQRGTAQVKQYHRVCLRWLARFTPRSEQSCDGIKKREDMGGPQAVLVGRGKRSSRAEISREMGNYLKADEAEESSRGS